MEEFHFASVEESKQNIAPDSKRWSDVNFLVFFKFKTKNPLRPRKFNEYPGSSEFIEVDYVTPNVLFGRKLILNLSTEKVKKNYCNQFQYLIILCKIKFNVDIYTEYPICKMCLKLEKL